MKSKNEINDKICYFRDNIIYINTLPISKLLLRNKVA